MAFNPAEDFLQGVQAGSRMEARQRRLDMQEEQFELEKEQIERERRNRERARALQGILAASRGEDGLVDERVASELAQDNATLRQPLNDAASEFSGRRVELIGFERNPEADDEMLPVVLNEDGSASPLFDGDDSDAEAITLPRDPEVFDRAFSQVLGENTPELAQGLAQQRQLEARREDTAEFIREGGVEEDPLLERATQQLDQRESGLNENTQRLMQDLGMLDTVPQAVDRAAQPAQQRLNEQGQQDAEVEVGEPQAAGSQQSMGLEEALTLPSRADRTPGETRQAVRAIDERINEIDSSISSQADDRPLQPGQRTGGGTQGLREERRRLRDLRSSLEESVDIEDVLQDRVIRNADDAQQAVEVVENRVRELNSQLDQRSADPGQADDAIRQDLREERNRLRDLQSSLENMRNAGRSAERQGSALAPQRITTTRESFSQTDEGTTDSRSSDVPLPTDSGRSREELRTALQRTRERRGQLNDDREKAREGITKFVEQQNRSRKRLAEAADRGLIDPDTAIERAQELNQRREMEEVIEERRGDQMFAVPVDEHNQQVGAARLIGPADDGDDRPAIDSFENFENMQEVTTRLAGGDERVGTLVPGVLVDMEKDGTIPENQLRPQNMSTTISNNISLLRDNLKDGSMIPFFGEDAETMDDITDSDIRAGFSALMAGFDDFDEFRNELGRGLKKTAEQAGVDVTRATENVSRVAAALQAEGVPKSKAVEEARKIATTPNRLAQVAAMNNEQLRDRMNKIRADLRRNQ